MTLREYIDGTSNWQSPAGPQGSDYQETYIGLAPMHNEHPPSLRNPKKTPIPTAQDGWKKGDSKEKQEQAKKDMVEIHRRLRRQIGKPEVAHTALFPIYPNIRQGM